MDSSRRGVYAPNNGSRVDINGDSRTSRTGSEADVIAAVVPPAPVDGETREERIARYKEMRRAALAARAAQTAEEDTPSAYVPKYLKRREDTPEK